MQSTTNNIKQMSQVLATRASLPLSVSLFLSLSVCVCVCGYNKLYTYGLKCAQSAPSHAKKNTYRTQLPASQSVHILYTYSTQSDFCFFSCYDKQYDDDDNILSVLQQ